MTYIKYFTTIVLVFVSLVCCFGQDVIINSQADMDAFDPNTTVINGYLYIKDFDNTTEPINNFNNLSNLTTITGGLTIKQNSSLTNINGLSNLTSIGGDVYFYSNSSLININGLSSLASVGGFLYLQDNDALTNINGLSNLTSIEGYLYLQGNNVLTNIDGLSGLTSFNGDLTIDTNLDLTNIDGLSNLTSFGGNLTIETNISLTNIDGLSGLTSFNGDLTIRQNSSLENVDGLSGLTSFNGDLFLIDHDVLTNIDGLSSLTSFTGHLSLRYNVSLINLDGLSGLTSINGSLSIIDSHLLENVNGLSNLAYIEGNFYLGKNTSLTNIDGLSSLTSTEGYLFFIENPALINIDGLSNLTSIGNDLLFRENDALINIDGLSNLASINNDLTIDLNPSLTNTNGLSNLVSVGGYFTMYQNAALENIDGLSNLTTIGEYLYLQENNALTNIDGLFNLTSIGGNLRIEENGALTNCCGIQNILNISEAISGGIYISNNPSECSSQNEILNIFCGLSLKIFNDIDQDCNNDNDEFGINNRMFIVQPGNIIGETGNWFPNSLPIGNYTVTIDTSGTWSPTCSITQSFTVSDPFEDTVLPTFGLVSTEPCTAPDVSIHMPFMRPCFDNQKIYIHACNTLNATGTLEDAFVVLELDSLLTPTSSLIPYTDLGNHMYQFDIGTLNPGICVDFWIETTLSCDAELGQGLCMEAQLFPAADCVFDDIPNPLEDCNTTWDMSSLTVNGYCENDTVFFEILNSGSGDMTCFSPVRVYINGNLIILDSVQLVSGEIAVFSFSGDGQSWRLETDQHPLHPGNSQPNAMVEGCGGNIATFLSYINAMPLDDADPVVDIYCGIVTGSYDPNDKTGFPLGVNESNDILPNQQIEYLIRFQNTGTDTAFTVVIRDTLSTDFDIFSVQSGVASHDYDFTINDGRAMEWTFNNILLPDSTTNEIESHGFIKFTVNQIPNLAEGVILENTAAIYFDFNDPIITNTSQHTINYFTPNIIATTNINEEACNDYTSPSGNYTWSNSGTYYDIIETENGDSIVVVDLMITISDLAITDIGGSTLTANINDAEYQWLDCNNNLNPIEGATNQDFTTTEVIGDYAVQVTLDGCTVISDCFSINTTGIVDHEFANAVNIHPNPTNNRVFVDLGKEYQATSFTLRNILGQTILKQQVNASNEFHFEIDGATGLYLLEIETNSGQNATFKILKN